MGTPKDFITTTSILTFGGASLGVLFISTAFQRVTARNWIIVPFITALIVGFVISGSTDALSTPLEWLVALVNSCILFCTVTGANELAASRPAGGIRPQGRPNRKWFVSWF